MTPPTTTTRSHRVADTRRTTAGRGSPSPARRRAAQSRRRRRWLGALLGLAVIAVAVMLAMPLARRAVNEFGLPLRYSADIRRQAAAKHLDPALVAGVIYAETKFDPRTSPTGAEGPMQIEPATALDLAKRSGATTFSTHDLGTPSINIAYGSYYIRYLLDEYHGSVVQALAAYNGGEANVDRWVAGALAHGAGDTRCASPRSRFPRPAPTSSGC